MAFIQCDFISMCLNRDCHFNAYLPGDRCENTKYPLRALYLLHDYYGSCWDVIGAFDPERISEKYGMAVIMPEVENHFYVDDLLKTELYAEFIGSELPEFTRRMLPVISPHADDTYICGAGMGGYGALHVGLTYPGEIGHIIAIDPLIVFGEYGRDIDVCKKLGISEGDYRSVFGDEPSDANDIFKNAENCENMPEISIFCKDENRECIRFAEFLTEKGIPHRFLKSASEPSVLLESALKNI